MHEYPEGNISAMHYVGLPPAEFEETPEPEIKKTVKKKVRYIYIFFSALDLNKVRNATI